jgi:signal transduction histidine kinase
VLSNSTVLSFSIFNNTTIKIYKTSQQKSDYQTGKSLVKQFSDLKDSKVAIVFADGLNTNGEVFLKAFYKFTPNIEVAGGLAGDNATFTRTYLFTKDGIEKSGAIAAVLFNPNLIVNTSFSFGWEEIGKELTVTKAVENVVYSIDNMTPTEIYKKYLGEEIESKLPATGIEFPLIINRKGNKIARAVVGKNDDGSLVFAGNIKKGDKVYLGYGNIDHILGNRFNLYDDLSTTPIQSIFIYSCMARKRLLGDDILNEIIPLSKVAPTSGFFTYGEFFSCNKNESTCENHLFNQTMTVLTLSESSNIETNIKDTDKYNKIENIQTVKALSHLISVTSKELNDLNQNLGEKIEQQVEKVRSQELLLLEQSKNASMGEMISNIAHQWRQPLSAITTTASSIHVNNELGILTSQEINSNMNLIINKANYLSETINTFRDFLKIDKKKKEFIIEKSIEKSLKIVNSTLRDLHIDLIISIEESENKIIGIESELSQVIINIINNAKDILIEKNIEDPWVKIGLQSSKNKIVISIEDNGGGIPKSILPKIFEPYFTTKHQSQGTGLGLHMSYRIIVESLNGKLWAKNTKNGANFFIEIPLMSNQNN